MKFLFRAFALAFAGVFGLVAWFFLTLPDVRALKGCLITSMYQVNLCPEAPDYVAFDRVSKVAVEAILASEDTTFYSHHGFDWHELKLSFDKNMALGEFARGGSTITQQLAKNVFLSGEKSLWRKAREAWLTYEIEKNFNKKEILEKYLNVVEFGPNIFGIRAAARHYFAKEPAELGLLEGAYLAMVLPSPKKSYYYFKAKKLTPYARRRVLEISRRLVLFRKVPESTFEVAKTDIDQFPWQAVRSVPLETAVAAPADVSEENNLDPDLNQGSLNESFQQSLEENDPDVPLESDDTVK